MRLTRLGAGICRCDVEVRRIGVAKITQAGEMLFWGPTGLGHIAQ